MAGAERRQFEGRPTRGRQFRRDFLLTASSAGLYALAFPPLSFKGLAWIALVPLFTALRRQSLGGRLALAWAWSVLAGWGVGTWMPGTVSTYFQQPAIVGWLLWAGVATLMAAPYYMSFAAVYRPLVVRGGAAAPLLCAAAWAAAECVRGRLLNGDLLYVGNSPWATFGYSQAGLGPMVQIASVTGVYGVSFALACVNSALAEAWAARRATGRFRVPSVLGAAALTVAIVVGYGLISLRAVARDDPAGPLVKIALIQANLDAASRWDAGGAVRTLDAYSRLTRDALAAQSPAVVFWPEAALTFFLEREPLYQRALGALLGASGAELVVGAPRAEGMGGPPYRNSVYLIASDGHVRARYDKQYLLPFMEYFPLGVDVVRRHFARVREFTPGAPTPPLPTRLGPAGILVCNEAMLPQLAGKRIAEGAAFLVNPSNDSWAANRGFAQHLFDIASMRAVEQRVYLVRISDSGVSALVDPYGRTVVRTQPLESGIAFASLAPPVPRRSVYGRVGDLFAGLCTAAVAFALLRARRRG
jgi:apolipoprotein N-acyltransferase